MTGTSNRRAMVPVREVVPRVERRHDHVDRVGLLLPADDVTAVGHGRDRRLRCLFGELDLPGPVEEVGRRGDVRVEGLIDVIPREEDRGNLLRLRYQIMSIGPMWRP